MFWLGGWPIVDKTGMEWGVKGLASLSESRGWDAASGLDSAQPIWRGDDSSFKSLDENS